MTEFEQKLRAQWCALPRAARWKIFGGVCIVFSSLSAQMFFAWLYVRVRDTTKPMLFPSLIGSMFEPLWKGVLNIVFDNERQTLVTNLLALNVLAWALWVAWMMWRAFYPTSSTRTSTRSVRDKVKAPR